MEEIDYTENTNIFDILLKIVETAKQDTGETVHDALIKAINKEKQLAKKQNKDRNKNKKWWQR